MNDNEKLEKVTEAFTRAMLANTFEDKKKYIELAQRLAALIDTEIAWQYSREEQKQLMSLWGSVCN